MVDFKFKKGFCYVNPPSRAQIVDEDGLPIWDSHPGWGATKCPYCGVEYGLHNKKVE